MTTGNIDILIRGAKVVDGTGNPWYYGEVAISGDRVLEIAPPGCIPAEAAREVVDAAGMVICPGFIDILSHSHIPLMHDPRALSKITQGVTTEIMGEGWTPAPAGGRIQDAFLNLPQKERLLIGDWPERAKSWSRLRHWLDAMVERGVSPNIGSFLGGGTLREYARGLEMGAPTPTELETMRRVMLPRATSRSAPLSRTVKRKMRSRSSAASSSTSAVIVSPTSLGARCSSTTWNPTLT